ncbi:MAG: hypothetical protein H6707_03155 [Deltaproteobacteria bacterium]|nr:hypothetical protein [Deltaproteobacteria bacterium]
MNRVGRILASVGAVVLITLSACGSPELTLSSTGKATEDPPDWLLMGYAIARYETGPTTHDLRLLAIYYDNRAAGSAFQWSADFIAELPSAATTQSIGIGGLAGHPTDEDILYLYFTKASGAQLWSYELSTDTWTQENTGDPSPPYWGLGANCNGDLTAVARIYSTSYTVGGSFVSFDPSDFDNNSVEFDVEGASVADNAGDYYSQAMTVAGREDGGGYIYTTEDGENLNVRDEISEPWAVGLMSNPVLLSDSDPNCKWRTLMATASSSDQTSGTPLYAIPRSPALLSIELTYVNGHGYSHPGLVDLANIPGWCSASLACATESRWHTEESPGTE